MSRFARGLIRGNLDLAFLMQIFIKISNDFKAILLLVLILTKVEIMTKTGIPKIMNVGENKNITSMLKVEL